MNTPVSFESAKLLKEKGFDKYCHSGYTEKGDVYLHQGGQEPVKNGQGYYEGRSYTGGEFYCSAPTIAEVVMWLYKKHGIWTVVNVNIMGSWYFEHFDLKEKRNAEFKPTDTHYDSPTEAYEAGIEYTLKNLL